MSEFLCNDVGPHRFVCSKPDGHDDPHAATEEPNHTHKTWPNENDGSA